MIREYFKINPKYIGRRCLLKMIPLEYLRTREKIVLYEVKKQIKKCNDETELLLLKSILDDLIEISFKRYKESEAQ